MLSCLPFRLLRMHSKASRSSTKTIRVTSRSITAALIEADGLQY